MGFVHLATFIYHKNEPNVGKNTSPMDGMGSLFLTSSVGPWGYEIQVKKTWMIRKKHVHDFIAVRRSNVTDFLLVIMRHPQRSSRRSVEHETVIQIGQTITRQVLRVRKNPWESKKPGAPGEDWP